MKRQYISPTISIIQISPTYPLATSLSNKNKILYGGSNIDQDHEEADSRAFYGALIVDDLEGD